MTDFDVIVIGAGPAGSTAARFCAKSGLKTLLVEKDKLPREKRCAGGVSKAALMELDFSLPEEVIERRCYGMTAVLGKMKKEVKIGSTVAAMVTRSEFDFYLALKAKEAGAALHDQEECLSLAFAEDAAIVETPKQKYRCNLVIGADGVHSRAMRIIRHHFHRQELRYCLAAEIPVPSEKIKDMLHDTCMIWYGFIDKGYAWLFPKGEYISAGIGGNFEQSKQLTDKFTEFLALNGLKTDKKYKGCLIPMSEFRNNVYAGRLMLAGDAGGFVDAFSGEGIRFAVASGKAAAATAAEAHKKGDFTAATLKSYQEGVQHLIDDLRCSHKMTNLSFNYPNLVLATAIANDEVVREYFKTMTGELSFVRYFSWFTRRFPYFLIKRFL